jgi:hypothetical protein
MHRVVLVSILVTAASAAQADAPRKSVPLDDDALGAVTFSRGSTRLVGDAHEQARRIANWQQKHPDSVLIIDARTKHEGTRRRSLRLSQTRTDAVRMELLRYGADPTRMMLLARTDDPGSSTRGAQGRVVIRATNFTGPAPVADVAARETSPSRRSASAPRGRDLDGDTQAPAPAASTTVVVVPAGGAGSGNASASRAGRTSGGNGTSAQTGLGFDPTDTDTIGTGTSNGVVAGTAGTPSGPGTAAPTSGVASPVGAGVTGSGIGPTGTGNGPTPGR